MNVKVLGPGCGNCKRLFANTQEALKQLGLAVSATKVEDYAEIAKYNVMSTPALVVDEEVLFSGKVPSAKEIADLITKGRQEKPEGGGCGCGGSKCC